MTTSIRITRVFNIPIEIDISWLIIFALLTFSLAEGYLPQIISQITPLTRWITGIIGAVLFFLCVLIHELSHSYVAQKNKINIKRITLFIFGGIAHISQEPSSPKAELKIAIAGPVASLVLGAIFLTLRILLQIFIGDIKPVIVILDYLFLINIILAIFNLVPAFPLDGGRIFRALIWWKTKNLEKATKIASLAGQGFAFLLIFWGLTQILHGMWIGGLWLIFIGWFLYNAAQSGWQQTMLRHIIMKKQVKDLMTTQVITVPPDIIVTELIEKYFLMYRHIALPVVKGEDVLGLVTLHEAKTTPQNQRSSLLVKDIMTGLNKDLFITPSTTIVEVLNKMRSQNIGRWIVIENNKLKGILSKTDILRFFQIKMELGR